MTTSIEWARNADGSRGETWNPTVGCSRVSEGCTRCYAMGVAHREMQAAHAGLTVMTDHGVDWNGVVRCLPERLGVPASRRKPTTFFVDSMSDLFHPEVPTDFIGDVFDAMGAAKRHTFQVLTKRPSRMASFTAHYYSHRGISPYRNVWLGTSIESATEIFRANHVRRTMAAVKFLSLEPLLGDLQGLDLVAFDWVIAGGESGPGARPCHPDWVRHLRDGCTKLRVPFLMKQWGAWKPVAPVYSDTDPFEHEDLLDVVMDGHHVVAAICPSGHSAQVFQPGPTGDVHTDHQPCPGAWWMEHRSKKEAGRELDGQVWDQMPARTA